MLGYRAWAQSQIPQNETKARDAYRAALDAGPGNPFHLTSFVEYEIFLGEKLGTRSALAPGFKQAISRCRAYIDAGIELPWSFFNMGRIELLLDQPYDSLASYAKAIQLCLEKESTVPVSALETEIAFLRRINRGRELPESHAWILQLLLLGQAVRNGQPPADLAARHAAFARPVVILAGGTARDFQANIQPFEQAVKEAFQGFRGTLISGGTDAGVAGWAGAIAKTEHAEKGGRLEVLGYIPRYLPHDQPRDSRYSDWIASEGLTYGPGHALQYWTDLLLAGVKPQDVRLLGIDGGLISAFEFRLALALGASVGVMEPATRAAADLLKDPDWREGSGLIGLPDDKRSVQAFVQPPRPALTETQLDAAAQKIHAAYLEEKHYLNPDPAMQPWDKLEKGFQDSNRMQAAAIAGFLERAGFHVEPVATSPAPLQLTKDEVELLAEMEHGRWVVERLLQGWRYGEVRDTLNKIHPDLKGWGKLEDTIRDWDRSAVRKWPQWLADAGLQVRRE